MLLILLVINIAPKVFIKIIIIIKVSITIIRILIVNIIDRTLITDRE